LNFGGTTHDRTRNASHSLWQQSQPSLSQSYTVRSRLPGKPQPSCVINEETCLYSG
jgi:hypothetical protein